MQVETILEKSPHLQGPQQLSQERVSQLRDKMALLLQWSASCPEWVSTQYWQDQMSGLHLLTSMKVTVQPIAFTTSCQEQSGDNSGEVNSPTRPSATVRRKGLATCGQNGFIRSVISTLASLALNPVLTGSDVRSALAHLNESDSPTHYFNNQLSRAWWQDGISLSFALFLTLSSTLPSQQRGS